MVKVCFTCKDWRIASKGYKLPIQIRIPLKMCNRKYSKQYKKEELGGHPLKIFFRRKHNFTMKKHWIPWHQIWNVSLSLIRFSLLHSFRLSGSGSKKRLTSPKKTVGRPLTVSRNSAGGRDLYPLRSLHSPRKTRQGARRWTIASLWARLATSGSRLNWCLCTSAQEEVAHMERRVYG